MQPNKINRNDTENFLEFFNLEVNSGEANVFVCENDGKEFIAKVYNRADAIKPEIIEKFKSNLQKKALYVVAGFNARNVEKYCRAD